MPVGLRPAMPIAPPHRGAWKARGDRIRRGLATFITAIIALTAVVLVALAAVTLAIT
jgi:hypothetical protein